MTYILDRWEGKWAVLENQETRQMETFAASLLPKGAKEGDLFASSSQGFRPLDNAAREKKIQSQMDRLFRS